MTIPILIDCDPGHDDAIAILLALASPEVEVRGITTVGGNQTLEKTTRNALKILELAGRADIPVAEGAAEPHAAHRRERPRRERPRRARPAGADDASCRRARRRFPRGADRARRRARADGAADERRVAAATAS
jgi:inosine-uridine nucleoside N-ribohydrolase